MPRPCHRDHPPSPGSCRLCRLVRDNGAYRRLWGPDQPCLHLGADTGETVACPSCNGPVKLKVFACAVHARCTTGKKVEGVACCKGCPDFGAAPCPQKEAP